MWLNCCTARTALSIQTESMTNHTRWILRYHGMCYRTFALYREREKDTTSTVCICMTYLRSLFNLLWLIYMSQQLVCSYIVFRWIQWMLLCLSALSMPIELWRFYDCFTFKFDFFKLASPKLSLGALAWVQWSYVAFVIIYTYLDKRLVSFFFE